MKHFQRTILTIEALEDRYAPATLVNATTLTYQDSDGDNVTVTLSNPLLTAANVDAIFVFDTGNVNGDNSVRQQLRDINLLGLGAAANGTSITTTATRSAANGGDGFAALGEIVATDIDLGKVKIDGDLGRILAGDANQATTGLQLLKVHSLGRFGTTTGAKNLNSVVQGALGKLKTKTDVRGALVDVQGTGGTIGVVSIGGSLTGGDDPNSGVIRSASDIGPVTIGRDLVGGDGDLSGQIFSEGRLASVTIGGSVLGGGGQDSGSISSNSDAGLISIAGDLRGGLVNGSGSIFILENAAGIHVGGSVTDTFIFCDDGNLGPVTIGRDLVNAEITADDERIASVSIGGSMIGGAIQAGDNLGPVNIGGDLIGGSANGTEDLQTSGCIVSNDGRIASVTIGGSLIAGFDNTAGFFDKERNGDIRANLDIGSIIIKGSIIGNVTNPVTIAAGGSAAPTATTDVAMGSISVGGRVEHAQLIAGFGVFSGLSADAQIGAVTVGGDWIASNLVAGAVDGANELFGDADDSKLTGFGVRDVAAIRSRIASLTIGGQALGTVGGADHFGIVAEQVGTVTIGGVLIPTTAGTSNDDFLVGITGDFKVNEI